MGRVPDIVSPRELSVAMVIQRFRPHFSGQGEQVELLCQKLVKRGVRPTIITSAYNHPSSEEVLNGYRVVRLRAARSGSGSSRLVELTRDPVFAVRVLAKLLRDHFDLIHVHATTDGLYTSWLWCQLRRRPLLFEMTLLGADDPVTIMRRRGGLSRFRGLLFRRCDGYVAMSPALERRYREADLPDDRVRLLPQGVDLNEFTPVDGDDGVRSEIGIPPAVPIVVFVGSLIYRKGIDVLLRAWGDIYKSQPDAHLVLVGRNNFPDDPDAHRFLVDRMNELPMDASTHVHQLGVRDDIARLLRAADVFVFPSRREGFGTVMIEAMSCSVPCVVTELPGITDFVFGEKPSAGVIVPQEDHGAIASTVAAILANRVRAATMGQQGRDRVTAHFDIDRIADCYVEYYAELIGQRGSKRRA